MTPNVIFQSFSSFFLLLILLSFLFSPAKGNNENNTHSSAFEFIKHLQGCHKGSRVQGLHGLKLYLARFGYLNYQHTHNHTNAENDYFDEELEAALKTYQDFYHLNTTGTLDGPTVAKMVMARCGQPDRKTPQYWSNSIHVVSHFQFFEGNPKWPVGKTHLTYAFKSSYPEMYVPPVVKAFNKWASASGYFTFSRVGDVAGADLKISFERGDHGDGRVFTGPDGSLAHAFSPPDGRFHYDGDENWSIGPDPNAYDLETVALHEIGHLLGLAHSQDMNAIMWSTISHGEIKGLNVDDIQGIKTLYGVK